MKFKDIAVGQWFCLDHGFVKWIKVSDIPQWGLAIPIGSNVVQRYRFNVLDENGIGYQKVFLAPNEEFILTDPPEDL